MTRAHRMSFWDAHVLPHVIEKACRSRAILEDRRRWIPRAHGDVLELGVGSGLNLSLYDPARVERVTGIDPSAPLLERAAQRARAAPVRVDLVRAHAEQLPFADRSFDSVVVTYSLCSVADLPRVLAEVRRVLRAGGELFFVEHGLARDPAIQRWQRRLTPLWSRVGGGGHLDRDIAGALREAGYDLAELRAEHAEGARLVSFVYEGVAR